MTRLVAAGLSFRTAPLEMREAAAVAPEQAHTLLRYLVGHAGFSAASVLSTCNRTEYYVTVADSEAADVVARLAPYLDPSGEADLPLRVATWTDREAVEHLFRIAAGLESMAVGEVQVLGQLKDAHRLARDAGALDAHLDFVMRRAISVGKLVHTRTDLGKGAASLSEVAVACAREVVGELSGKCVLLIGAGKMSTLAARRLRELGARILVTSRGESKERLAGTVSGDVVPLNGLEDFAPALDVVFCSTASGDVVLDAERVARIQERRERRSLCIVDIAVPRDVDPAAARVPGVTLIDIDELGRRIERHVSARRQAIPDAEQLIETELRRTMAVIGQRDAAGPTISALNRRAEALRRREVERAVGRARFDRETLERIDTLTTSLVRKLLHGPIVHLRESADDPSVALTLRRAFDLDDVEPEAAREQLGRRGSAAE